MGRRDPLEHPHCSRSGHCEADGSATKVGPRADRQLLVSKTPLQMLSDRPKAYALQFITSPARAHGAARIRAAQRGNRRGVPSDGQWSIS